MIMPQSPCMIRQCTCEQSTEDQLNMSFLSVTSQGSRHTDKSKMLSVSICVLVEYIPKARWQLWCCALYVHSLKECLRHQMGTVPHPLNAVGMQGRKNCWLTMQDCLISVSSQAEGSTLQEGVSAWRKNHICQLLVYYCKTGPWTLICKEMSECSSRRERVL